MTCHDPHIPPQMQRTRGEARVEFTARTGGGVRLAGLRQQGSAKVMLPHVGAHVGDVPEVVFLNTSGGLTGGDRLSYALALGAGVRAVATTQTAERAYQAGGGVARVDITLDVGAGGHLDWMPQETILFDRSALDRRTVINLAAGASCVALESVILGRAAMQETVADLRFSDRREFRSAGRLVQVEPLRLTGAALGAGRAVLGGARAFASLILIAPDAPDRLAALRAVLDEQGVQAAASSLENRLICRMLAVDGWPLRRQILRALTVLRPHSPMPRVWQL